MWGTFSSIAGQVKDLTKDALIEGRQILREGGREGQGILWKDDDALGDGSKEDESHYKTIERLKLLTQSQLEQMNEMETEIVSLQAQLNEERKKFKGDTILTKQIKEKDVLIEQLQSQLRSSSAGGKSKSSSQTGSSVQDYFDENDIWAQVGLQTPQTTSSTHSKHQANKSHLSVNDEDGKEIERLRNQAQIDMKTIEDLKSRLLAAEQKITGPKPGKKEEPVVPESPGWSEIEIGDPAHAAFSVNEEPENMEEKTIQEIFICIHASYDELQSTLEPFITNREPYALLKKKSKEQRQDFKPLLDFISTSTKPPVTQIPSLLKLSYDYVTSSIITTLSEVLSSDYGKQQKAMSTLKDEVVVLQTSHKKSTEELESKIKELSARIGELGGEVSGKEAEKVKITMQLKEANESTAKVKQELDEAANKVRELEKDCALFKSEYLAVQGILDATGYWDSDLSVLEEKLTNSRTRTSRHIDIRPTMQSEGENAELLKSLVWDNFPSLRPESGDLQTLLSNAMSELQSERKQTEAKIREEQTQQEAKIRTFLLREQEIQEAHHLELISQRQESERRISILEKKIQDHNSEVLKSSSESSYLEEQIISLRSELQLLKNENLDAHSRLATEIERHNQTEQKVMAEMQSLHEERMKNDKAHELELQKAMEVGKFLLENAEKEYSKKMQAVEEKHALLITRLNDTHDQELKDIIGEHEAETKLLHGTIEKLKEDAKQIPEVVEKKDTDLVDTLKSTMSSLEANAKDLALRLDEKQREYDAIRSKLEKAEEEFSSERVSMTEIQQLLNKKLENLTVQLAETQEQERLSSALVYKEIQATAGEISKEIGPSLSVIDIVRYILKLYSEEAKKVSALKSSEEKLMKDIGWFLSEFKSRYNQSWTSLNHERNRLLGNLQTVLSYVGGKEGRLKELLVENEQLMANQATLESDKSKSMENASKLELEYSNKLKTLQNEHEILKKQYQKDITDLAELRRTRSRVEDEARELKQKNQEMEKRLENFHGKEQSEEKLQSENIRLRTELSQLQDSNAVLLRKSQDSATNVEKLKALSLNQEKELERLRSHLIEVQDQVAQDELSREDMILSLRQQLLFEQERYKSATGDKDAKLAELNEKLVSAMEELRLKSQDLETSRLALQNLETVLEQFQEEADMKQQQEINPLRQQIKSLEEQNAHHAEKISRLETLTQQSDEIRGSLKAAEYQLRERTEELRICKLESMNLRSALESSLAQMTKRTSDEENTLDKRIIGRLLITYFENSSRRQEVLELMCRILGLTEEEKAKVGLRKPGGGWFSFLQGAPPDPALQGQNLADLWLDFLQKEAESARKPPDS